jgi:hypothetical protein
LDRSCEKYKNSYYIESRRRGISYIKYTEGRLSGLVTSYVGSSAYNRLLKEKYNEGQK